MSIEKYERGDWKWYALAFVVVLLLLFAFIYGLRWFSNATTPITVHEVEPGVRCATMVTSDGAAIDCWRVE